MFLSILLILFLVISTSAIRFVKCSENNILNIDTTTQLRGIAILGILFAHVINNVYFMRMPSGHPVKYIFGVLAPLGVAVFLFLSGYGNVFSFNKNIKFQNLIKKCIKLYIPFGIVLMLFFIFTQIMGMRNIFPHRYSFFTDFITLYIPPFTFWYLQVQLLAYITLFVFYRLSKKYYDIPLTIFWTCFVLFCIINSKQGCWWVSTLCFPLGCIFAKYNNLINQKIAKIIATEGGGHLYRYSLILCLLTVASFVLSIFIGGYAVLLLCIIACLTFSFLSVFIRLKSNILKFLGSHSLEIYLIHFALMYIVLQSNYNFIYSNIINSLAVIILSVFLAIILKQMSDKLFSLMNNLFFK